MVVAQVMGDKLYFKYGVESEEMDAMTESNVQALIAKTNYDFLMLCTYNNEQHVQ